MASLWGHLDGGVVFAGLGLWWMFHLMKKYLQSGGRDYFVQWVSVASNIFGRELPIEIYLKIFCSVAGAVIELFNGGRPTFIDDDGNIWRVTSLQHISIYSLFFIHAILDLLRYHKVFYIDGLVHLTAALAFLWYGTIFHFHTLNSDKLENIVHTMGMIWCFATGLSILWEYRSKDKFLPCYCRCLAVFGLGTWFIHTPFILFSADSFPGNHKNPRWDRDDPRNYQFVATMFAFHLCFLLILSVLMYTILRFIVKPEKAHKTAKFRRIPNGNVLDEESGLLSDEDL